MMRQLTEPEILHALTTLGGWEYRNDRLTKTFSFNNFIQAMHFINKVGRLAEQMQHHPDIVVQYNHVTIHSSTHDAGNKVTEKDVRLATEIEQLEIE